jgi:uncharacterized protein DUF2878
MNILNFILFQTAWFFTILPAAYGKPYIGVFFTMIWMLLHLSIVGEKRNPELMLIVATVIIAYLLESSLVIAGLIVYPEQAMLGTPAPVWMITLWINLSLTINYAMSWLKGRYLLSALLAAIAGPLTYYAGERFGAITLNGIPSLIAISIMWLIAMPLLFCLSRYFCRDKLFNGQLVTNGFD